MTPRQKQDILDRWELTEKELTEIIDQNPSMRGLMLGYVAEYKLKQMHFTDPRFTSVTKDDDHDRKKKGDLRVTYRGRDFKIECKSLQTKTVKLENNIWTGKYQCDASDRREVTFKDGSKLNTTCLLTSEFDLIAVNMFAFGEKWHFGFALNDNLPRSRYKKYTEIQREQLLSSLMPITLPLQSPYSESPFPLLDQLIDGA